MKRTILSLTALVAGVLTASAAPTVEGWWPYGELPDYYGDMSGNAHRFGYAFSRVGSGNAGAVVEPFGCGGPLGSTTWISTNCLYWNAINGDAAGMWGPGFNPPSTNYVIELWCLPVWPGTWTGSGTGQPWLFCSGTSGGVYFQLTNDTVSTMTILARIVGNNTVIGDPFAITTNRWTHLAVVNDNGTQTFYVNGIQHGAPDTANATTPAGDIYAGSASGTTPTYAGFLDELRIWTFAAGAFSTNDLLIRSMKPNILSQPRSASVWTGGAAPFNIGVAFDSTTTYQWRRGGANVGTGSEYYLNTVAAGDSGAQVDCVLNNYTGTSTTSSVATLTVVDPNPSNVGAYQNAVKAETSLVAYYTGDSDTGSTLADTKGSSTGTLEGSASWDGRTTRAFGVRALRLRNTGDGDVRIENNPAFEFQQGNGTIETVVYLDSALAAGNRTIFAQTYIGGGNAYYQIQASADGTSLIYHNDALTTPLSWAVSPPLLGRQAHVAFVFANNTVTAYVDGLPLGTKTQPSFGSAAAAPSWIGSAGGLTAITPAAWSGTIDELAIYSSALPANTIAIHNSKFLYGTNTSPPTIVTMPVTGTKTLLAGGRASFTVQAGGTAPLAYQWTTNGVAIPGATTATLTLSPTSVAQSSAEYGVTISNPYGSTNSPTFGLTFVAPTDRYATMVMADNPMAYWRMDESGGTTTIDSAGGHDGTYSGSVTLGAAALPNMANNAAHFTGGNATIPYSAALNPSTAFSVEFWAKPDDEPSATYVPMSSQFRGGGARAGWCFYDENDAYTWEIHMGDSSGVTMYCYGGGPRPYGGQWYHVVAVYDPSVTPNATVYAENQVVGTASGNYVPNASAPLMIGVRNGGSFPFNAVLDEVAMYNYALTREQVSNHWSIKFEKATITTQPVGVTTNEGSTLTLTAVVSGFPNTYQWYKGATPLTPVANFDGTAHYPQDVTNATLVITEAVPGDSGQYHVVVSNPLGGATSGNATVTIIADTTPPSVALVQALGTPPTGAGPVPFVVKVLFNERVDSATAVLPGNYSISGGVTINTVTVRSDMDAASLGTDWKCAFLQTSGLTPGQKYTLTVAGIKDQATTPNTMGQQSVSFWAPPLAQGKLSWDYYYKVTPQAVASLLGFWYYQSYAPTTNGYLTAFDTHQITGSGGDLDNNPLFAGGLGNDYGDVVSGWVTPSADGDYTFFLASDDASQLYFSTNDSPADAVLIAEETGCCQAFLEPNPSGTGWHDNGSGKGQTSLTPIHLLANHRYFIRVLHTEGGGGDWVKVAWRAAGDNTPAANLSPIPSQYLSSYVLLPPTFNAPTNSNGKVTISWTGIGTLLQSTNVALPINQWTPVAGNPASPYEVTPATAGPRLFYRLQQ